MPQSHNIKREEIKIVVKVRKEDERPAGNKGECFYCQKKIGQEHTKECVIRNSPSLNIKHPKPHGWIQWKGTDVCMDISCKCGYSSHIDSDFTYHIKCPKCGQVYECDGHINLIPLDFEPENTKVPEL